MFLSSKLPISLPSEKGKQKGSVKSMPVPLHIHQSERLLASLVPPATQFSQFGFQSFAPCGASWGGVPLGCGCSAGLGGRTHKCSKVQAHLWSPCVGHLPEVVLHRGQAPKNARGHFMMLSFLSRSPATHECFVGNLKLQLNRIYRVFLNSSKTCPLSLYSQHTLLAFLKHPRA